MACLGENTVTDLVESLLAPSQRAAIEAHTAECDSCRRLISELVRRTGALATGTPPTVAPTAVAVEAGTRVGRYVVREQIGKGAMGAVYAAHDPELDRTIAIKLLHPGEAHRERIQREARALAKLSHPNVVTALDLGELDGDLALAMELVEGTSLDKWIKQRHSIDDVLDAFRQAGRGLAAAHDAGLVHRDFKPENVVIGSDGRVRVVDFGLAAGRDGGTDLVGTPAYMAPEQLEAGGADAASDQFAFCVSLYQALHGVRPFAVNLPEEIAYGLAPGPTKRKVPPFASAVLARGLDVDPAKRFPSMAALLAALSPRRTRTRTRIAIGAGAIVAITATAVVATRSLAPPPPSCGDSGAAFRAMWNPVRAVSLHAKFTATGVPFAESSWRAFDAGMATFGERWIAGQTDACEASRIRGVQSDQIFTLRSACLAAALAEADALASTFASLDAKSIAHAASAVDGLPSLAECANVAALIAPVPPPTGRDAAAVAKVMQQVAVAKALRDAAKWTEARAIATQATAAAAAIDHAPTRAAALFVRAEAEEGAGSNKDAEATLRDAFAAAELGHDDLLAARVAAELEYVLGDWLNKYAEGLEWAFHAETQLKRAGGNLEIESRIAGNRGHILFLENKLDEARAAYQQAYDLKVKDRGAQSRGAVEALYNIGRAVAAQGDNPTALEIEKRALSQLEALLGADHPDVATVLDGVANIESNEGKWADALADYDRALASAEPRLGPDHPEVGRLLGGRGITLTMLHRGTEAMVTLDRAVKIFERPDANQELLVTTISVRGDAEAELGRSAAARADYQRAIAIAIAALGHDTDEVAEQYESLATLDIKHGDYREALAESQDALAIRDKADQPGGPDKARTLVNIGEAELGLGNAVAAVAPLRSAFDTLSKYDGDPVTLADVRLSLARAIWDSHGDHAEAHALAAAAEAPLAGSPSQLAELHAWQRTHP